MGKIWVVLTDDWELRGNGTGTVEEFQRKPALRLMDLYESLGIRSTFNLEVMQQLAFEQYAPRFPEIQAGHDAWIQTARDMVARGFDTQLHIHPQWWRAEYLDGWWKLGRRWDISAYSSEEIAVICAAAFDYLDKLFAPRKIHTFRAGSWGMGPPSREILQALIARGVKIDVSIAAGLIWDGEGIKLDYSDVESPYCAYRPDLDDIRRVGREGQQASIIELPTQSVTHAQLARTFVRLALRGDRPAHILAMLKVIGERALRPFARLTGRGPAPTPAPVPRSEPAQAIPDFVMRDPFGLTTGRANFGLVMDICMSRHPAVLNHMADTVIERARRQRVDGIQALVFENHTKDLRTDEDFARIRGLIEHIRRHYPDVEFRTLSDVVDNIAELSLVAA